VNDRSAFLIFGQGPPLLNRITRLTDKPIYTEQELLGLIAGSDQNAFRLLFDQYRSKVYSLACRLTKDKEAAEDVVQEVFTRIWLNKQSLTGLDSFEAWLRTITRNHIYNKLRRLATEEAFLRQLLKDNEWASDNLTLNTIAYNELHRILQAAEDQLTPRQKEVYRLGKQEGLKYEDIAQTLQVSKDTVKFHMTEALRSIKEYLTRHEKNLTLFVMILCEKIIR